MNYKEKIDNLQNKIIEFYPLIEKATNVGLSDNEKDIYYLIDRLTSYVHNTYNSIMCKNKCSSCCINAGLPRVTTIEWQVIFKYLKNEVNKETLDLLIKRTISLHSNQINHLMEEQERIQEPHTRRNESKYPRPKFKCLECPFLIDHSCSIYKVRPAICRTYGYFTIRIKGKSKLFTCQMSADSIFEDLKNNSVENLVFPVWDKFAERIYEINLDKIVSTLPLWLMSHLDENNNLLNKIDLNPDFNTLYRKYNIKSNQKLEFSF